MTNNYTYIEKYRNKSIIKLNDKINKLKEKKDSLIKSTQKTCKHEFCVECDYQSMDYFDSLPPSKLCLNCGLKEDGWGCGYEKLKDTKNRLNVIVPRNILYKLRY